MNRARWTYVGILLATIVLVVQIAMRENPPPHSFQQNNIQLQRNGLEMNTQEFVHVTHVIDGDTIDVKDANDITYRVRFIGIDTPETVKPNTPVECIGREASARVKELLNDKSVVLERKPSENTDKYGRLLRYVVLDTVDIGAKMVEEGLAKSNCEKFPHPRCKLYEELEKNAKEKGNGMWSACGR